MGVPGAAGFRFDMGESGAGRRVGNADEMIAGGALNLAARVAGITLQRLVAVGTIEFEFECIHGLHLPHAPDAGEKYVKKTPYLCPRPHACKGR
jgi:hypothetical protein